MKWGGGGGGLTRSPGVCAWDEGSLGPSSRRRRRMRRMREGQGQGPRALIPALRERDASTVAWLHQ